MIIKNNYAFCQNTVQNPSLITNDRYFLLESVTSSKLKSIPIYSSSTEKYLFLCLNSRIPQHGRLCTTNVKIHLLKFDAMAKWCMLSVHRVESFHLFCSASATSPPASVLFQTGTVSGDLSRCADLQRQEETASLKGLYFIGTLLKLKKKRKASYLLLRDKSHAGHYHNCIFFKPDRPCLAQSLAHLHWG